MKIVIYSDAQFNPWKDFSKILPNGRNSRLQDQLNAQDEVFKSCIDNNASLLVHTGDLFESLTEKIDKITFLTVYDKFVEFSKSGVVVVLVVGNHDWLNKTESEHILEPFREIENVIVVDSPKVEEVGEVGFCFLPYTRINFTNKINEICKMSKDFKHRYLFTHQGVRGAKVGPRDTALKDEFGLLDFKVANFTFVFNGHYHKFQLLGSNFVITGSLIQKDFGEREDKKGFLVLDTETKTYTFIENQAPKFYKVEVKKKGSFIFPEAFTKDRDFLWVVTEEASILDLPELKEIEDRVRIDVEISRLRQKPRTNININMSSEEQIKEYVIHAQTELSKDKLALMGVDKWKRSQ